MRITINKQTISKSFLINLLELNMPWKEPFFATPSFLIGLINWTNHIDQSKVDYGRTGLFLRPYCN